jgi:hypothetical protein
MEQNQLNMAVEEVTLERGELQMVYRNKLSTAGLPCPI